MLVFGMNLKLQFCELFFCWRQWKSNVHPSSTDA